MSLKNQLHASCLAIVVTGVLTGVLTGCVSPVSQMQTARTLPPKKVRVHAGASVPISSRFAVELVDAVELATDRLRDARDADRPLTEEEQRQAIESAAAILLLQPAVVPEFGMRIGVFDHVDVGLQSAGPTFRLDAKWHAVDMPGKGHAALQAAYTHHTGIGASIAGSVFDLFESLKLVEYSRKDLELALLASTEDQGRNMSFYGGLRYFLGMPRIESLLAAGIETQTGMPLVSTETDIHEIGATAGIRVGTKRVALMAELTVLWMVFAPEIFGEESDLGGLIIAPGVGAAFNF
ncbi:MAG TPA: hypothetical protein VNM90_06845 [Haliangium sp.]|nr:hypothetical protein [Haliangium sp.]